MVLMGSEESCVARMKRGRPGLSKVQALPVWSMWTWFAVDILVSTVCNGYEERGVSRVSSSSCDCLYLDNANDGRRMFVVFRRIVSDVQFPWPCGRGRLCHGPN